MNEVERIGFRRAALDAIASAAPMHGCCYAAGPISTSREIWLANMNHDAAETVAENRRRIHAFVERLRSHLPYPVIDSALLEVSHWDGHDYGEFFIEVLRRHAKEIRFLDGWEYSRGATKEFVAAVEWADIALYDERGAHLSAAAGADLLRSAIADLTRYGVDAAALRQREIQLAELARSSAQVN